MKTMYENIIDRLTNTQIYGGKKMGFFNFFKGTDINQGIDEYKDTDEAVLVDVRTPQEYRDGHISGSKNVPLQSLDAIARVASQKETPLFVYCHSGARSRQAVGMLGRMGYTNVKNLGGIVSYTGEVVR